MQVFGSDPRALMGQLSAESFAQGVVNVIDVSAIHAHAPERWERRRLQVEDHLQRAFKRRARASDALFRLSETQFVAIQPEATRIAAIACCATIAQETLGYFLGAEVSAPVKLLVASGYGEAGLAAADIRADEIAVALSRKHTHHERLPDVEEALSRTVADKAESATRFVVQTNPTIEAILRLDPIWHPFHGAVASFLVQPLVFEKSIDGVHPLRLADLGSRVAGAVAAHAIDHAAAVLREANAKGRSFGLHVVLPVDALTPSRERLMLQDRMKSFAGGVRERIVIELGDCADGMPQSRMVELVNAVKPYCRAVIARVAGDAPPMAKWRDAGLSGVAIVFDAPEQSEKALMRRLAKFANASVAPRTLVVAHGLGRRDLVLSAWSNAYTHISGQVITDQARSEGQSVRLSAAEIFAG